MSEWTPGWADAAEPLDERGRRWRLILGKGEQGEPPPAAGGGGDSAESGPGDNTPGDQGGLSARDQGIDDALEALYGDGDQGGLDDAIPDIARWLGDIRTYFPAPVAQIMQRDLLKRVRLRQLLADPDLLRHIEPDLSLVTQLLALQRSLPTQARDSARQVVTAVVDDLRRKLEYPLLQALSGSLDRALRTRRPRHREINWLRTIHANLRHYQPSHQTVIPETLIGHGRRRSSLRDVILCIDQSGSMAKSVVYASIFGAVMASLPALSTRLVVFSTNVVDLTDQLADPVDLLFGLQLRGGTNIERAVAYCQERITRPRDTILVLISDLYEGGNKPRLLQRIAALLEDGVQIIALLALNDDGAPRFDRQMAQELVDLGIPAFACTPQLFPDLMAAAIAGRDIRQWAATHDIVTAPSN